MSTQDKDDLDSTLESAMRDHLKRYVETYKKLSDKEKKGLDLLECRVNNDDPRSNRIIDRELLGDYLSLKLAKSNYRLQWIVAIFAFAASISAIIEVLKIL